MIESSWGWEKELDAILSSSAVRHRSWRSDACSKQGPRSTTWLKPNASTPCAATRGVIGHLVRRMFQTYTKLDKAGALKATGVRNAGYHDSSASQSCDGSWPSSTAIAQNRLATCPVQAGSSEPNSSSTWSRTMKLVKFSARSIDDHAARFRSRYTAGDVHITWLGPPLGKRRWPANAPRPL